MRSLVLATAVAAATAVLGLGLAWLVQRTDLPAARAWTLALTLPLALPSYIGAFTLRAAFAPGGLLERVLGVRPPPVEGFWAAFGVLTLLTYPYVLLVVAARLRRLPAALEESAACWDGRRARCSAPSCCRRCAGRCSPARCWCSSTCVSDFAAVQLLGYDTLTRAIFANLLDRPTSLAHSLQLAVLALAGRRGRARRDGADRRRHGARRVGPTAAAGSPGAVARSGDRRRRGRRGPGAGGPAGACWATGPCAASPPVRARGRRRSLADPGQLLAPLAGSLVSGHGRRAGRGPGGAARGLPGRAPAVAGRGGHQRRGGFGVRAAGAGDRVLAGGRHALGAGAGAALREPAAAGPGLRRALRRTGRARGAGGRGDAAPQRRRRRPPARGRPDPPLRGDRAAPAAARRSLAGAGLVLLSAFKELPATLLLAPPGFTTLATEVWAATQDAFWGDASLRALVLVALSALLTWLVVLRRADGLA